MDNEEGRDEQPMIVQSDFETSEFIDELAPAIVAAQAAMGVATKDTANPFYKSKYADLASILEVCKEPLNKAGLAILQPIMNGSYPGWVKVKTILLHQSGQWASSSVEFPATKDDCQGYGSACKYARRYSLESFICIPAQDDDGNAASQSVAGKPIAKPIPQRQPRTTPAQASGPKMPFTDRFGEWKGKLLCDVPSNTISDFLDSLEIAIDDPDQAKYKGANESLMKMLIAEIERRK